MTTSTQTPYTYHSLGKQRFPMDEGDVMAPTIERKDSHDIWVENFLTIYEKAVQSYENGAREPMTLFTPTDVTFLASIGATAQEIFDFVEDWVEYGEPDVETVLHLTELRRDYFLYEQQGRPSGRILTIDAFPPREASLGGFAWLPRIIAKAKAKLRGELPPDLMYGCGGDRRFLRKVNMDVVAFLQLVAEAKDKDEQIVQVVQERATL